MVNHTTVSIPVKLADEIDKLMEKLGFWPSRGAFVREAILAKIRQENKDWLPDSQ